MTILPGLRHSAPRRFPVVGSAGDRGGLSATSRPLAALPLRGRRAAVGPGLPPVGRPGACGGWGGGRDPRFPRRCLRGRPCARASLGTVPLTFRSRDARTASLENACSGLGAAPRCRQRPSPGPGGEGARRAAAPRVSARPLFRGRRRATLGCPHRRQRAIPGPQRRYQLSPRIGSTVSKAPRLLRGSLRALEPPSPPR